jgi:TolB-like protein
VVVTRFENLSGEQIPPITEGFTEQLITTLNQIPDLAVKKGRLPAQDDLDEDIAEDYDVLSVVRGSVQEYAGQLRVTARIVDSEGITLWAGTVDGPVEELFRLHEQVAKQVHDAIVGETEDGFIAPNEPTNSVAYLRYVLGQSFLAKRDVASLQRAAEIFLESVELDPEYGPAYLALANTYVLLADYVGQSMFDVAVSTVEEGVARDPSITEPAQTYRGYVQTKLGQWAAATESFETATSSSTGYPPAQHYHSRLMAATGRIGDSLDAAIAAWQMDQDEQVLVSRLAIAHMWNNDMEQARKYYEIANAQNQGAPIHLLSYTLFLIREGEIDEAAETAHRAVEKLTGTEPIWVAPVFEAMKQLPDPEPMVAELEEYSARGLMSPTALVTLWALAGEADRVMEIAWKMVEDNNPSYFELELIYLDEFKVVRQHEDFPRFLDEIGLTEYWQSEGCRWDVSADTVVCD